MSRLEEDLINRKNYEDYVVKRSRFRFDKLQKHFISWMFLAWVAAMVIFYASGIYIHHHTGNNIFGLFGWVLIYFGFLLFLGVISPIIVWVIVPFLIECVILIAKIFSQMVDDKE
ncbi:MAG TPA: hypothetical protein VK787_00775 [Puia sp.]|jgi:hypothetical protein|nr:hypothetical protein [Puia sp.]